MITRFGLRVAKPNESGSAGFWVGGGWFDETNFDSWLTTSQFIKEADLQAAHLLPFLKTCFLRKTLNQVEF